MIWAVSLVCLSGAALAAWHFQRPGPPRVRISFLRFLGALPPAPTRATRLALVWPRDPISLLCLVLAVLAALWALRNADRAVLAERPDHLGLRVVLDASHSMSLTEAGAQGAGATRYARALARIEAARRVIAGAGPQSLCVELVAVGAQAGPVTPLPADRPVTALAPAAALPQGADPARLTEAAALPRGACALSHVLIVSDLPPTGATRLPDGVPILWDQIGAPQDNAGLRSLALRPAAFGQVQPELLIFGSASAALPERVLLNGPGRAQELPVMALAEGGPGAWQAIGSYAGPGRYEALLPEGGAYRGDDRIVTTLSAPPQLAVDWRLSGLARPAALAAGGAGDLLVTARGALRPGDLARPLIVTYPAFPGARAPLRLGAFREDPALLRMLSLDALEAAGPAAWPAPLPPGFLPVLTLETGAVIAARRLSPPGLILPEPVLDPASPARNLTLALFFGGLAELAAPPPQPQPLRWGLPDGTEITQAWRESATARPAGRPADLALLTDPGDRRQTEPAWPWALVLALAALLGERLNRALRRKEGV